MKLDFETRSRVDLKACGADVYATDPSTDIICCAFIDGPREWLWTAPDPVPPSLRIALIDAEEIEAHNARFDQLIYECIAVDYGFPPLASKWVCTAAQCRVNALPASLDGATRAINAKHKKDHSGTALIRKLCVPNAAGEFNRDSKLLEQMGAYCLQDTRAMTSLTDQLRPLAAQEKIDWRVNEKINDRGLRVDIELATLAQSYATEEKEELGQELSELTGGLITKTTQTARALAALVEEATPAILACVAHPTDPTKYTFDKSARAKLLDCPDLSTKWHEIVSLIDQGGKSSVAKFTAMINRADPDTDRVHGAFIFAGAGQTSRFSSKGLQMQNMIRACYDTPTTERLKTAMRQGKDIGEMMDAPVMTVLAKLLRPSILPAEGYSFVVGDWSAIEARVLPWLADTPLSREVLEVFRQGEDIYVKTAEGMGLDDRQIGKVATLSLGYGGGVGAFQAMATNYGVVIHDHIASAVVKKWRAANRWAGEFWKALEKAARAAVRRPATVQEAGRIRYVYTPQILGGTLMCVLPDDTVIQYPYARLENGDVTCMKASVPPAAESKEEWPRMTLWGGFLAENVTQAASAALLKELLWKLDLPVVGHVHDEVILEVLDSEVTSATEELKKQMETCPDWAEGLPLKAEPCVMKRYGK